MYLKNKHFVLVAMIGLLFFIIKPITYNWNGEDCYITYRVAENFSEGNGLVFNKGENVEAHSNFLWTVILGIFHKIGFDTQTVCKLLSVLSVSLTILLLGVMRPLDVDSKKRSRFELIAPILYLLHPIVHYQCDVALETTFYVFLIVLGVYFLIRSKSLIISIVFSMVAMTRPEGFGFFIVAIFICLYQHFYSNKKNIMFWFYLIIPFLLFVGALEIWRLSFYGYLFPNTVYAKTSGLNFLVNSSFSEIRSFIISCNFLPLFIFFLIGKKMEYKSYIFIVFCFVFSVIFYIIMIGKVDGSYFQHYITMIPFIVLLLQEIIILLKRDLHKYVLLIIFICLTAYTPNNLDMEYTRPHKRVIEFAKKINYFEKVNYFFDGPNSVSFKTGMWLRSNFSPNTKVISGQMGQLGYFSGLQMIDMWGLADSYVAHSKSTGFTFEYALSRDPDMWVITSTKDGKPSIGIHNYIINSDEFKDKFYLYKTINSDWERDEFQFCIYLRY